MYIVQYIHLFLYDITLTGPSFNLSPSTHKNMTAYSVGTSVLSFYERTNTIIIFSLSRLVPYPNFVMRVLGACN